MLIRPLFEGPVDIVGDVHGHDEVLEALLQQLRYEDASHPTGRRLVFVGDLVDRGPHSLRVVRRVRDLVKASHAQCILGNHELNLLRRERKDGNDWFFALSDGEQDEVLSFLRTLPLALERKDLRVVHACWHDEHVERVRDAVTPVASLVDEFERGITRAHPAPADAGQERSLRLRLQCDNPIKVLTSGLEEATDTPFFAGGAMRYERRVPWWDDYDGTPMVVVGHYWRSRTSGAHEGKGPDLFEGTSPEDALGKRGRVMCVDYSIGKRRSGSSANAHLAAYRYPERTLTFAEP